MERKPFDLTQSFVIALYSVRYSCDVVVEFQCYKFNMDCYQAYGTVSKLNISCYICHSPYGSQVAIIIDYFVS